MAATKTPPSSAGLPSTQSPGATRPRDGDATRATILTAARAAFDGKGYAQTSLREIARNAGVRPSLVVHFYGSKAGLLAATVEWPFDPDTVVREVLAMGPDHIGERLADVFLDTWEQEGRPNTALTLLHAACERPEAVTLMRELFTTCVIDPIVTAIAPERAELRASLVASHLLGLHVGRYLLNFDAIDRAEGDLLKQAVASTIQHMCTGPLWSFDAAWGRSSP
ncbi:TetR family transcriptional regulator [Streptomyces sp. NPDC026673]|uniref:TetR/AcrR family transcriptional regulator n=1 Tax=Streptomyces sp. NPDC026673 TaxID=3155724 RepID=UPI0033C89CDD